MRSALITAISSVLPTGWTVSQELPYEASGVPIYTKNARRLYVDLAQRDQEQIAATLSGCEINQDVTTIPVSVICDAKALPANYDEMVTNIRSLVSEAWASPFRTTCAVATEYIDDMLLTTFEFRLQGLPYTS